MLMECPTLTAVARAGRRTLVAALVAIGSSHLPADPAVRTGTLPNGLRYFIRPNATAADRGRVEIRLVVNAGSLAERTGEDGFAHLVEHMAFAGTRHFPGRSMLDWFESLGLRFGDDVNAYTTFDQTVFRMTVPADTAVVSRAVEVVADWARGISFDSAAIAIERGVVLEEWRGNLGATPRVAAWRDSALYAAPRQVARTPMGASEAILHASAPAVRRFYQRWYRPDAMAVIVVGDVQARELESLIVRRLGALHATRASATARPPRREAFSNAKSVIAVDADPRTATAAVEILYKEPVRPAAPRETLRRRLAGDLFCELMQQRLRDAYADARLTVLATDMEERPLDRAITARRLGLTLAPDDLETAIALATRQLAAAATWGFTPQEIAVASARILRPLARDSSGRRSATYAASYVRSFTIGDPLTSPEEMLGISRALLDSVNARDLANAARGWLDARGRVVLVTLPGQGVDLRAWQRRVRVALQPAAVRPPDTRLRSAKGTANEPSSAQDRQGSIVLETRYARAGVTEWTLTNGARVLLKPTTFGGDEVLLQGYARGGWAGAPDDALLSARFATDLLPAFATTRGGSTVQLTAAIDEHGTEIDGSSSPRDVGALLRQLHVRMTTFALDSATLAGWRRAERLRLMDADRRPEYGLAQVLAAGDWRRMPLRPEMVNAVDAGRATEFVQRVLGDAGAFVFILVGAFDVDSVRPLVERYVASLPAEPQGRGGDVVRSPRTGGRYVLSLLDEPVAVTYLNFTGRSATPAETYLVGTIGELLRTRANRRLRQELGATYGVDVRLRQGATPDSFQLEVEFRSAPDRVQELDAEIEHLIRALQRDGPTIRELTRVRAAQRQAAATQLGENAFWVASLRERESRGLSPGEQPLGADGVADVGPDALRDAAARMLDWETCVRVTLVPSAKLPKEPPRP
jgi:zinc protease